MTLFLIKVIFLKMINPIHKYYDFKPKKDNNYKTHHYLVGLFFQLFLDKMSPFLI